jgi:succinate-acetate transporter protein
MRRMRKARTFGVVLIGALGGCWWLSVSLIPFMPLMGIRHSEEVNDLVGAGSVGWLFQLLGDWWWFFEVL